MPNSTLQRPSRRYSVLVGEDDADCRESLGDVLASDGFETFLASCGEEALDIFQSTLIDLLVMDMCLPDLTGLEIFDAIKRIARRTVPCIFVTGQADDDELRRQAMLADAFTVLPKPVSANLIRAAVRLALKRYY
jgi:DNA-binding response OmpR family regulator